MPRHPRSRSSQVDRNEIERERRKNMKDLLSRLSLLTPPTERPSKGSLPDQLVNQTITHIKEMKERVEMLKQRKQEMNVGSMRPSPFIDVWEVDDSRVQVCLTVTGLTDDSCSILSQVIDVIVDEAAHIVALNYFTKANMIFYTIQAQAVISRIGIETSSLEERLKNLISPTTN